MYYENNSCSFLFFLRRFAFTASSVYFSTEQKTEDAVKAKIRDIKKKINNG